MQPKTHKATRTALASVVGSVALLVSVMVEPAFAVSRVTAVSGNAYGYRAYNISLFGGVQPDTGPTPTVTLAANASNSPQNASATSGTVAYGPAVLLTSDTVSVSTSGSLGTSGSASASSSLTNVNKATTQPTTTGSEILTADSVASTCSALISGTTRSVTITNGTLQTDSGWDDGDAVYPEPAALAGGTDEHDPVTVTVPTNPSVGQSYNGHIHLSGTSQDDFTVVFNERPDANTVNAVHEYFGTTPASVLHGDLILGRSSCGVTVKG